MGMLIKISIITVSIMGLTIWPLMMRNRFLDKTIEAKYYVSQITSWGWVLICLGLAVVIFNLYILIAEDRANSSREANERARSDRLEENLRLIQIDLKAQIGKSDLLTKDLSSITKALEDIGGQFDPVSQKIYLESSTIKGAVNIIGGQVERLDFKNNTTTFIERPSQAKPICAIDETLAANIQFVIKETKTNKRTIQLVPVSDTNGERLLPEIEGFLTKKGYVINKHHSATAIDRFKRCMHVMINPEGYIIVLVGQME